MGSASVFAIILCNPFLHFIFYTLKIIFKSWIPIFRFLHGLYTTAAPSLSLRAVLTLCSELFGAVPPCDGRRPCGNYIILYILIVKKITSNIIHVLEYFCAPPFSPGCHLPRCTGRVRPAASRRTGMRTPLPRSALALHPGYQSSACTCALTSLK